MLNGNHLRAARCIVNWSREELAKRSGVAISDIRTLERSNRPDYYKQAQMMKLIRVYEKEGITFTSHGIEWLHRAQV